MRRVAGVTIGLLMLVLGGLWTLQGLEWLDGGSGSRTRALATLGPIMAGFGVALGYVTLRGRR